MPWHTPCYTTLYYLAMWRFLAKCYPVGAKPLESTPIKICIGNVKNLAAIDLDSGMADVMAAWVATTWRHRNH